MLYLEVQCICPVVFRWTLSCALWCSPCWWTGVNCTVRLGFTTLSRPSLALSSSSSSSSHHTMRFVFVQSQLNLQFSALTCSDQSSLLRQYHHFIHSRTVIPRSHVLLAITVLEWIKWALCPVPSCPSLLLYSAQVPNKQVVISIRHKARSLPHMDGSVVFARLRQCTPHLIHGSLVPPHPNCISMGFSHFWSPRHLAD